MFQDDDVLWLYEAKYTDHPDMIPPVLHPDNWFTPFGPLPARNPERGHRR
ncbi:hypothetical protein ACFWBC_38905 [Streptomyces sp. NPDC059985]